MTRRLLDELLSLRLRLARRLVLAVLLLILLRSLVLSCHSVIPTDADEGGFHSCDGLLISASNLSDDASIYTRSYRRLPMNRERGFLVFLIVVFGLLAALLVRPFLQYVLAAILLGYVLYPLQRRLTPHVGSRISALLLVLVATLVVFIPVASLLAIAIQQAISLLRAIARGDSRLLELFSLVERYTGISIEGRSFQEFIPTDVTSGLLENALTVFGSISDALIGITVLAFLLYYLLVDGAAFVQWLRRITPLTEGVQDELYAEMDRVMWGVLVGNVLVALVQGVLTGIGLAIAGVPGVVFWTVVTTLLSLLPLIGASVVWLPASV